MKKNAEGQPKLLSIMSKLF